jgi:DNA-binding CsgD family transcriptional regulator
MHVMRHDIGYELRRLAVVDPDAATAMAVDAASVLAGFADSSAIDEVLDLAIASGTIDRLTPADQARVWLWASCMLARSPDGSAMAAVVGERWRRGMALVDDAREPLLGLQARLIAIGNGSATGDLALSARAAIEGRALAEAAALPAWLARFEVWSAAVSHARGDVAGAVSLAGQALARAQRIGDSRAIVCAAVLLHALPAGRVPAEVPVPELEDALRLAVAEEDPMVESLVLAALTQRELREQNPSAAALWCARRLAVGRRRGWAHLATISLVHAALIGVRAGDYPFAARMVGAVRADEDRTLRSMTPATREAYVRAQESIRGRLGSAHAGRIIAGGGIMSTLDAVTVAMRWLDDHSTAPHTSALPSRSITVREQDVLELLAAGLTNKQIAERLSLSVKTVMHHSVAIYRKLGVRGRAEATATAYRYGLLRDRSEDVGA